MAIQEMQAANFLSTEAPPAASDPYAPFKEAIKAGKVVEFNVLTPGGDCWRKLSPTPAFNYPPSHYRIKPDPTPEPVKWVTRAEPGDVPKDWLPTEGDACGDPYLFSKGSPAGVTLVIRKPTTTIAAQEGEGTITFPYTHVSEPSTALPAVAGLGVVWQDPCWARR